ncbi:hypothetical protein ACVWXN_009898 [Bradyrhizobium sp. i1.4.4]
MADASQGAAACRSVCPDSGPLKESHESDVARPPNRNFRSHPTAGSAGSGTRASALRETAAGGLRAGLLASRRGRGGPHRLREGGGRASPQSCRRVRGAGLVRDPAACADPRQDAALHRDRRGGPRCRWRHLPTRVRRRHRHQGADGRAAAHRGAGVLSGADAAAIPRDRGALRFLPAGILRSRASRSPQPAPRRCSAWSACAARSRRALCSRPLTRR